MRDMREDLFCKLWRLNMSLTKKSAVIKTGKNFNHSSKKAIENKGFENFGR